MANDFLIKKWKQFFHLADVDKDNLMTMKDGELFAERFSAAHKFDNKKTAQVKEKSLSLWKKFVLAGRETMTEAEYIQVLTERISANQEQVRNEFKEGLTTLAEIIDVNNDGFISTEQLMCVFQAWGTSYVLDKSFVGKFPQVKPGFIRVEDYAMPWMEHMINTDETVFNPVSEGLQALSDAGVLP